VVLFPGALLPLHIFEPRYRQMTADVLAGRRLLAMARLRPGYEADYEGRPPIFSTCGLGYVASAEDLPGGRYNLLVRGVGRVALQVELPAEQFPYRRIQARFLIDTHSAQPETLVTRHEMLLAIVDRLASCLREGSGKLREIVRSSPSPSGCTDVLAAAIVHDADERQDLLESLDPADRLDKLIAHVSTLLVRFGPGSHALN
jgi:Lon protease-like protein